MRELNQNFEMLPCLFFSLDLALLQPYLPFGEILRLSSQDQLDFIKLMGTQLLPLTSISLDKICPELLCFA